MYGVHKITTNVPSITTLWLVLAIHDDAPAACPGSCAGGASDTISKEASGVVRAERDDSRDCSPCVRYRARSRACVAHVSDSHTSLRNIQQLDLLPAAFIWNVPVSL